MTTLDKGAVEATEDFWRRGGGGWEGEVDLGDFVAICFAGVGDGVGDGDGGVVEGRRAARRVLDWGGDDGRGGDGGVGGGSGVNGGCGCIGDSCCVCDGGDVGEGGS